MPLRQFPFQLPSSRFSGCGNYLVNWSLETMEYDSSIDVTEVHEPPALEISSPTTNVVVVMDGMKKFTTDTLEWTLKNVVQPGCIVTLLGVLPWLNIPLFSKTRYHIWSVEMEGRDLDQREKWKIHASHLKLQAVVDLCEQYGVVPQKKTVMGYPTRALVLEQIAILRPTWVVFDRYQRKNMEFCAQKVPFNLAVMNGEGEVDVIKRQPMISDGDEVSAGELSVSSFTPLLS